MTLEKTKLSRMVNVDGKSVGLRNKKIIAHSPIVAKDVNANWFRKHSGITKYNMKIAISLIIVSTTKFCGRVALIIPPTIMIAKVATETILS
jgi:hypothetical protein